MGDVTVMALEDVHLPGWVLWVALGLVAFGILVVAAVLFGAGAREEDLSLEERVKMYASGAGPAPKPGGHRAIQEESLGAVKDAAAAVLKRNTSLEERIATRLEAAGSGFKASEWLLLHVAVVVLSGLVGVALGGSNIVAGLLCLALGIVGPWLFLGLQRSRRVKKFNAQLPDTLQLMSSSLAAGLSLAQSIDTIVNEAAEPMAGEFKRVLVETRLGVPLEDAMEGIVDRFDSKDFGWVVMAIRIQRQVGGNLAELLDTVSATIREREYMRRQVNALAAEGKMSAYVIGALPVLFLVYLLLTQPDYIAPMFAEPIGWLMLGGGVVMLLVGAFWMSKLVKVEV